LITARDMGLATAPALPARSHAVPFRERMLRFVLFVTVLASSVALIEPSPHDALMGVLALTCLIAGVRFDRMLALPLVLLIVLNIGGLFAYSNAIGWDGTFQFVLTSVYLALATLIFASLFADPDPRRLEIMRTAYVLTAVLSALAGIAGYFHVTPGGLFLIEDRAAGAFKDPNVFGPFLIWPALAMLERLLLHRIRFSHLLAVTVLLLGIFLSFSRGAWIHFVVSATLLILLSLVTAPEPRLRFRITLLTCLSIAVFAAATVVIVSIPSVKDMIAERVHLFNSYDVGSGGRFRLQEIALTSILDYPNGMGPLEFGRVNGLQQHNVYLQAFLVYGWTGAMAYFLLLASTIYVGLRAAFIRSPFQPYVITAVAALAGVMVEGLVIDTDHWRHFFLIVGIVWGAAAATANFVRQSRTPVPAYR
jgi:hypothetical protein